MHDSARSFKHWLVQLAIFFAIVTPVLILAIFSYTQTKRDLTNTIFSERSSISNLASSILEERFDRLIDVGISFATRVQFRKLVTEGKWNEAMSIAQTARIDFPYIDAVFVADTNGVLQGISTVDQSAVGKSFAYRDWYKGVSRNWKPYVSVVYQRANKPKYNIIAVAVPISADPTVLNAAKIASPGAIQNSMNKPAGILVFQVRLDTILEWTREISVGDNGFIYVVDRNGNIAAHPKFNLQEKIIDFSTVPAVQKALSGKSGAEVLYNPIEKETSLSAYHKVNRFDWGVIAAQATNTVFVARDKNLQSLLVFYGFILIINTSLAVFIIRMLQQRKRAVELLQLRNAEVEHTKTEAEAQNKELEQSKTTLASKISDLEKINILMVGRELKMMEIKKENEELKKKISK